MTANKSTGLPPSIIAILAEANRQRAAMGAPNPDPLGGTGAISSPAVPDVELSPAELLETCAMEPETDIGNGRRLMHRFGSHILHVTHVGWHGYDGKRWVEDPAGSVVRRFAHVTAEFIDDEAIKLDCTPDQQAQIEAGRRALERLREMGKPPRIMSELDDKRIAELDALIEAMAAAKVEKVRMGAPAKTWDDEAHAAWQENEKIIKTGRDAEREKRRMLDTTSSWTPEQYSEFDRLEKQVEQMNAVQKERSDAMSARHTFAKSSAGTNRINNMLAEAVPYVSKQVDDLNRDLYALNCANGTIRFWRDQDDPDCRWQARCDLPSPSDYIGKLAETGFDPQAACPQFERFFRQVQPDPDIRNFIQRFLGYCLTGLTIEQCLLFFYGAGRNGKSTLIEHVVGLLGDYAIPMSIDSFAGDSKRGGAEATPDLARLPGARLVAASEPEMGVKLKDALIKLLTGGSTIPVRRLHQDFFEMSPQFKLILDGNHKPVIHDDSDGIWRRVHLVPFDIQIALADVDPDLPRKLAAERAGTLAWMVRGALDYLNGGLRVPDKIKAATAEYREESDPIGAFIRNACLVTGADGDHVRPDDLHIAYCNYAKREGLFEFNRASFSKKLPDQTRKSWEGEDKQMHQFIRRRSNGTLYCGIRIRPEFAGSNSYGGGPQASPPLSAYGDDDYPAGF